MPREVLPLLALIALWISMSATPAAAAPSVGYDISYPQCGLPFPSDAAFGVVGVNGGRAFTANPCLAEQLAWGKKLSMPVSFYANTGNPGPALSSRWPIGQMSPRECDAGNPNSTACSYNYGWNAAKDSVNTAVRASMAVNGVDEKNARRRVANVTWWLDVEILNSWQTLSKEYGPTEQSKMNDTATLAGAVNALWDAGIDVVGIYSTQYQWNAITGGSAYTQDWFAANPVWLAGHSATSAPNGCSKPSFTGGRVTMTQYLSNGYDANYLC
jgi:hypothetical protein